MLIGSKKEQTYIHPEPAYSNAAKEREVKAVKVGVALQEQGVSSVNWRAGCPSVWGWNAGAVWLT